MRVPTQDLGIGPCGTRSFEFFLFGNRSRILEVLIRAEQLAVMQVWPNQCICFLKLPKMAFAPMAVCLSFGNLGPGGGVLGTQVRYIYIHRLFTVCIIAQPGVPRFLLYQLPIPNWKKKKKKKLDQARQEGKVRLPLACLITSCPVLSCPVPSRPPLPLDPPAVWYGTEPHGEKLKKA